MLRRTGSFVSAAVLVVGLAAAPPAVAADATQAPRSEPVDESSADRLDYCQGQCSDILPPGQSGDATLAEILSHKVFGTMPAHSGDQLDDYAGLASQYDSLSTEDINEFFNDASFGVPEDQVESVTEPRSDVRIVRDKQRGIPHIYGETRQGTEFGAGYAAAQDRLWQMDVLRHVGRGELSPFAGGAKSNRQLEQQFFQAVPYTEAELQQQIDRLASSGPRGKQGLKDAKAYVAGINSYIEDSHEGRYFPGEYVVTGHVDAITNKGEIEPFELTDLVVLAAVIGKQFGAGGGNEVQTAIAKLAVQERYGPKKAEKVWQGLRNEDDPETVRTLHNGQSFPYAQAPEDPKGVAMPDAGSVTQQQLVFDRSGSAAGDKQPKTARVTADTSRAKNPDGTPNLDAARGMFADGVLPEGALDERGMSNALVVSGDHTADGNPVAVFGPQTGYFAPQLLMLQELHGPGIHARGASFAGLSMYVLLGRGPDYAWSATSASQDVVDTYAVELCEPDGGPVSKQSDYYRFRGECVPMRTLERSNSWAPTIADPTSEGSYTLRVYRTKYGPVSHRAVVDGKPVAYTKLRSSYRHEVDSLIGFQMFNDPEAITSAEDFQRAAAEVNFTFNWFYADSEDTAYFNSGTNPVRDSDVNPSLPIEANAGLDWQNWSPQHNTADYTPFSAHPQSINQDYYVSWNNAQAEDYANAGFGRGAVHRGDLLDTRVRDLVASDTPVTRANLTQAMMSAGLADLRAEEVLPTILRVIDSGPVKDQETAKAVKALRSWVDDGGLRRESEPGSRQYGHSEAIKIMDAWWPRLVRAEFGPGLGDDAYQALSKVLSVDQAPSQVDHRGSAYQSGWWGYVSTDLRTVLGESVEGPLGDTFCGDGDLDQCRQLLLETLRNAAEASFDEVYPGDGSCEAGDQWCADALVHRALGGIEHDTISWQNRPTYQQVVQFADHR